MEYIPKGLISDCELGKMTYWPEQVIIMKQLLMFFMMWEVMSLLERLGARPKLFVETKLCNKGSMIVR